MRIFNLLFVFFLCVNTSVLTAQEKSYSINGFLRNAYTGEPIRNGNIVIFNEPIGSTTDSIGYFSIPNQPIGSYRLVASYVGYEKYITDEFPITNKDQFVEIFLEPSNLVIPEVVVSTNPFLKKIESPLSLTRVEYRDIEKNAGANRDISKVIQSYAGVSTPTSYRNDLVVRGGGPTENKFYLDGIEIPQINHFATQGASGGPVSILNADLIQSVNFYAGAYPTNKESGLSAILDIRLRDATSQRPSFKAVVGASEVAFSSEALIKNKLSYQVSVRQSYLQLLFKALGLPFLPKFTDGQFKVKYNINPRSSISLIGIGAIDNMTLNTGLSDEDEGNVYLLNSLPTIEQETYTIGAIYKYRADKFRHSFSFRRSYFHNKNFKYLDNDDSSQDNLTLDLSSKEITHQTKSEHEVRLNNSTLVFGHDLAHQRYTNDTYQLLFVDDLMPINYYANLNLFKYGLFTSWQYNLEKVKGSLGIRFDANNFSKSMRNPLNQFSPRASISWELAPNVFWNSNAGIYYQIPALTILGYKDDKDVFVNRRNNVAYIKSPQYVTGFNYTPFRFLNISFEGFFKQYYNYPISVNDNIVLASKGSDYGVWGNEEVLSEGKGRAYGAELSAKIVSYKNLTAIMAYTWVRSEFQDPLNNNKYTPSAWDNRNIFTATAGYQLPHNWDIGMKFRYTGGAPYTPYDLEKSSLVDAWDARGGLYYDYTLNNSLRSSGFYQLDVRVDKSWAIKNCFLRVYLDIQNVTNSKFARPDVYIKTGKILNPEAPRPEQRYELKAVTVEDGTILPTIGISFEY